MFTDVLRTMPWSTLSLKLEKGVAGGGKWMQEGTTDGICTRDANPCGECRQKSCDGKNIKTLQQRESTRQTKNENVKRTKLDRGRGTCVVDSPSICRMIPASRAGRVQCRYYLGMRNVESVLRRCRMRCQVEKVSGDT